MSERNPFHRRRDGGGAGPAGPRDAGAQKVLIGMGVVGLILLVLLLPPISLLSNDGGLAPAQPTAGGGDGVTATSGGSGGGTGTLIQNLPEGFEALSVLNTDLADTGEAGPFLLTVKLLQPVADGRNLGLYTLQDGEWVRLATGELLENGVEVKGQVATIPKNVAVLRRTATAVQVSGWLPAGAQADPNALAILTSANPLGVVPAADGSLSGAQAALPEIQGNVVPTVRTSTPEEIDAVNTILGSPNLRDAHVTALVQLALQPGNSGVELDYRSVAPARKAEFSEFVSSLADELHRSGRTLSLVLPLPQQTGVSWDTGAYDWASLVNQADRIKLAAETDPSAYYERMEAALNFLSQGIDLKKVQLIISRRSIEKGSDGLLSLSLHEALALASTIEVRTTSQIVPNSSVVIVGKNIFQDDGASGVLWDEDAFAVSFTYPGRGGQRTVWIENSLSLAFRLDLAQRYGLGGIALDSVAVDPTAPDVWNLLASYGDGGGVELVAPNSAMLRPTWQVQAGSAEQGSKGNVVWRAPAQPGAYDIALIVSDGVIWAQQKIVLDVGPASSSSADPSNGSSGPLTARLR